MKQKVDLFRDILDQQLVDCKETKMGRVDGLVLALDDDGPPRVDHFELGLVVLARRLHPRLEQWLQALRRWSVRKSARQIVPWSKVVDMTPHAIKVDVEAFDTPAFDWEKFMRKIVSKMPGSGDEP